MRHLAIAWSALLLLLSDPRAVGAQSCPQNSCWANSFGHVELFSSEPIHAWGGLGSYNLISGNIEASHTGGGDAETSAGITMQDRYRIVGPASGSPIPIQVRVHFSGVAGGAVVFLPDLGNVCGGSSALLVLASGTALSDLLVESQNGTPCASRTIDDDLALELQRLPGEEFPISVSVSLATGGGWDESGHRIKASAAGTLSFGGLPPGYSIQSCQGYTGIPVPVARRTWGALKQRYR